MLSKIIVVYHSIGEEDPFLQVSSTMFKMQIEYLTRTATLHNISSFFYSSAGNKRGILIMFDDAYKAALPAMKYLDDCGIPFVVAVVDSFLFSENYCSKEDLLQLKNAEFVFHTNTHTPLVSLSNYELEKELTPHNATELPLRAGFIVYPKGLFNRKVVQAIERCGFVWGLTCLPFHLGSNFKRKAFAIPRININGYLPFWKFKFFMSKWGNYYLHLAFLKRQILGEDYLGK